MPIIDFSGTYRDAARGMTLKALAARRAQMAEDVVKAAQPGVVADPLQGIAQIANTVSAGVREGRAANAEAAGRQRFAELLSGGLTPDEMGEAMSLDPETAMRYQEHDWAEQQRQADVAQKEKDALRAHGWDVDAAAARVQAEKDAAAERARVEAEAARTAADVAAGVAETKHGYDVETAGTLAKTQAEAAAADDARAAAEKRIEEQNAPGVEAARITATTQARRQEAIRLGMKEDSPEFRAYVTTGQQPNAAANPFAGPKGVQDLQEYKSNVAKIDNTLDDLNEAQGLLKNVVVGAVNRKVLDTAMATGEIGRQGLLAAGWTDAQIQATQRFNALMDSIATMKEAGTLKGALSDREMAKFMEIYNNPNATMENRIRGLQQLADSFQGDRRTLVEALASGGYAQGEYVPRERGGSVDAATEKDPSKMTDDELKAAIEVEKKKAAQGQ